ncbi:hypothetical protein ACF3M1_02250 [Luteimonas sp. WGS1318]|uniref:hypothetical protein n=1 Tax=Luteimonas sp. WGS1318 TaxID=3366815 RepID=UPI00372D60CF
MPSDDTDAEGCAAVAVCRVDGASAPPHAINSAATTKVMTRKKPMDRCIAASPRTKRTERPYHRRILYVTHAWLKPKNPKYVSVVSAYLC